MPYAKKFFLLVYDSVIKILTKAIKLVKAFKDKQSARLKLSKRPDDFKLIIDSHFQVLSYTLSDLSGQITIVYLTLTGGTVDFITNIEYQHLYIN